MNQKLQQIGLSDYESRCYLCLLKYDSLSAKEIAKQTNIPQTSVHRNLYSLIDKKFIFLVQKEPMLFRAIKPETAVKNYIIEKNKNFHLIEKELLKELESIKQTTEIQQEQDILEILRGRRQTFITNNRLLEKAEKEILVIGGGRTQTILDVIRPSKKAREKGVEYKFISGRYPNVNLKLMKEMKSAGISIKAYPIKNIRLIVIDKKESLLIIKDKNLKERVSLHILSEDLAKLFADYFDTLWKKSKKII